MYVCMPRLSSLLQDRRLSFGWCMCVLLIKYDWATTNHPRTLILEEGSSISMSDLAKVESCEKVKRRGEVIGSQF